MGDTTDNLKTVAQIRKAIAPLVGMVKRESDDKLEKRLNAIEIALEALLKKDTRVEVQPPEVVVNMPVGEIVKAIESQNLNKSEPTTIPSAYEPHDQAKDSPFSYAGFQRDDGAWYIQRIAKGEQRYAKGSGDYRDAWERRNKLKYGDING